MTCLVPFATKKALREAIARDPGGVAIKASVRGTKRPYFSAADIKPHETICVTNHPGYSWFALIKWVKGKLKVI